MLTLMVRPVRFESLRDIKNIAPNDSKNHIFF